MSEETPTPISRGVELQKSKIEEIKIKALAEYRKLAAMSKMVDDRIEAALSVVSDENTVKLAELFEQKHALDDIGNELEVIIIRAFEHQDVLHERWLALEDRLNALNLPHD